MARYAIGDIQGCYKTLKRLLDKIKFQPKRDELWLTGDIVNRGPLSLDVLRWARDLEGVVTCVLGNHDLYLLGRAAGVVRRKRSDTLDQVLEAKDCDELLDWLRERPILHRHKNLVLVHAGLLPQWTVADAEKLARSAQRALTADDWDATLERWLSSKPPAYDDDDGKRRRLHAAVSAFTRLRVCTADGEPHHRFSGPPREAPKNHMPWFKVPKRRSRDARIVFGHWAALGLRVTDQIVSVDTGCVWGNALTAVRLDDDKIFAARARD